MAVSCTLPLALALAAPALAAAIPARAQGGPPAQAPPAPQPPLFSRLITQPTGKNGYEELVRACDALKASAAFADYEARLSNGQPVTLAMKRRVLGDRAVIQALGLLKQGLEKQVVSPRTELKLSTLLPELSEFRKLGRLIAMQEYVQFADGRIAEALATAAFGLRFGRAVQTDTLISGLVGIAIDAIVLQPVGYHLEQLSARDCERLYQLCLQALSLPSLSAQMLQQEKRALPGVMQEIREKVAQGEGFAEVIGLNDEDKAAAAAFTAELRNSPERLERFTRDVVDKLNRIYDEQSREYLKPPWQRAFNSEDAVTKLKAEATPAAWAASMLLPSLAQVDNRYVREQAQIAILACHAAILRYRWEHERLPRSLEELNLGALALDPFTGEPLNYQVNGTRYTLTSAGPPTPATDAQSVNGRRPVSVTP